MRTSRNLLTIRVLIGLLLVAALASATSKQARAPRAGGSELIVNGSFEEPALGGGGWDVYPSIPGWNTSAGPGIEVQHRAAGSPFRGNQLVELDSHAPSSMYQDVQTQPNRRYVLSVRYSPRPGNGANDGGIEVWFDGERIDTLQGSGTNLSDTQWVTRRWIVAAKQTRTRIEFRDVSPANSLGAYLDDVSLRAAGR